MRPTDTTIGRHTLRPLPTENGVIRQTAPLPTSVTSGKRCSVRLLQAPISLVRMLVASFARRYALTSGFFEHRPQHDKCGTTLICHLGTDSLYPLAVQSDQTRISDACMP